jgi:hypothetical protein
METEHIGRVLMVFLCACVASTARAGTVIYVDAVADGRGDGSSWANACTDLQDALTVAATADKPVEIRVAEGTYRPKPAASDVGVGPSATFRLLNGVALRGGYAGSTHLDPNARSVEWRPTILDGNLGGSTSPSKAANVVTASSVDSTAVLDGFTITNGSTGVFVSNGNPTVSNCTFTGDMVCGVRSTIRGTIVLTGCSFDGMASSAVDVWAGHCVLTRSSFDRNGGLRAVDAITGDVTARDCTFTANKGAAIQGTMGTVDLIGCSFVANGRGLGSYVIDGRDVTARGCKFIANSGSTSGAIQAMGDVILVDCEFIGNKGRLQAGAVSAWGDKSLTATGCVFAGNSCDSAGGAGAIYSLSGVLRISNCVFIGNRGATNALFCWPSLIAPKLTQCIVWDGANPFDARGTQVSSGISVTYSDVQGGWPGMGNIDVDPCFADAGRWDPNGTPNDANDDIWVTGDYHLRSQAGHWDRALGDWVYDDVTSRCIDAGDPNAAVGAEPFPNGGYVNMGAYGGTVEASRTWFGGPVCPVQLAGDINGDCRIDDLDEAILMQHWLMEGQDLVNEPPTVALTSPQDGAELTAPAPVVLRVDASDPDGQVLRVSYTLRHDHGNGAYSVATNTTDPANGWDVQIDWSHIPYDGVYTIWAEAMDDEGARTTSAPITVTLHPSTNRH